MRLTHSFVLVVGHAGFAQVELSFNSAPRLVLQPALAIELIDPLPLGRDQQKLDLVVKLAVFVTTVGPLMSVLEMLQSIRSWARSVWTTSSGSCVRPQAGPDARWPTRWRPLGRSVPRPVGALLSFARMGEAERPDHGGQHQALAHQSHENDRKR